MQTQILMQNSLYKIYASYRDIALYKYIKYNNIKYTKQFFYLVILFNYTTKKPKPIFIIYTIAIFHHKITIIKLINKSKHINIKIFRYLSEMQFILCIYLL